MAAAALVLSATGAFASEAGPAFRWDLGIAGGILHFLGAQPFVLLFLTLALGTVVGRQKIGFFALGSTAGTLLIGILVSLAAWLGYGIRYEVPSLLTTVMVNLFMFAVGLKVGPQFFAGLRADGAKFVAISMLVVGLNFIIVFTGARLLGLGPGLATGIIAGSMTDSAVIGAATGAVESGTYQAPEGVSPEDVIGNVAAGYAINYLFSLIGIIFLVRYLPRLSGIDPKAAALEAENAYGGGKDQLPYAGSDAAYTMPKLGQLDLRALRVENDRWIGRPVLDFSADADVAVAQLLRGGAVVDMSSSPPLERGDILTIVSDIDHLLSDHVVALGTEVKDAAARELDLEVADLVLTNRMLIGVPLLTAIESVRRAVFPGAGRLGKLVQVMGYLRAGEPFPTYWGTRTEYGDIVRVLGPRDRIDLMGSHMGMVVRGSGLSDVLTLALGMSVGYIVGYLNVVVGGIPISLGTPAGVMLAGIGISTLRSRYPLFGGPVSEGARSLLQDLGLDLFIAVVALNTAPNVASAFAGGGVVKILAVGITAALVPPIVAWVVGVRLLRINPAVLLGALSGARFSTPAMRAAQEEAGSAVAAAGYPVPYAVSAVLVLVAGYLALFL